MKRESAGKIHLATSTAFWLGNPEWSAGNSLADAALSATRPLWRAAHTGFMRAFYDADKVLAVNGESVVAKNGIDLVDKHMFRYPHGLSLDRFEALVSEDIKLMAICLGHIVLPTEVNIKPAHVFRNPETYVKAVTQTQRRLDLHEHGALDLIKVIEEASGKNKDRTAKDLELVLGGSAVLINDFGRYPDAARSSGNFRRSELDGSVTLLDVMPLYANGSRAIGDKPIGAVQSAQNNLARFEEFVGSYGA